MPPVSSNPRCWPPLPTRKISETLVDFADPVTRHLPRNVEPERLERQLGLAVAVWNAMVLDEWGPEGGGQLAKHRAALEALDEPNRSFGLMWFDRLVKRKRKRKFRGDLRAIGSLSVSADPSGRDLRIRADARLSTELRQHYGLD